MVTVAGFIGLFALAVLTPRDRTSSSGATRITRGAPPLPHGTDYVGVAEGLDSMISEKSPGRDGLVSRDR